MTNPDSLTDYVGKKFSALPNDLQEVTLGANQIVYARTSLKDLKSMVNFVEELESQGLGENNGVLIYLTIGQQFIMVGTKTAGLLIARISDKA
jgi:hypothetical protein